MATQSYFSASQSNLSCEGDHSHDAESHFSSHFTDSHLSGTPPDSREVNSARHLLTAAQYTRTEHHAVPADTVTGHDSVPADAFTEITLHDAFHGIDGGTEIEAVRLLIELTQPIVLDGEVWLPDINNTTMHNGPLAPLSQTRHPMANVDGGEDEVDDADWPPPDDADDGHQDRSSSTDGARVRIPSFRQSDEAVKKEGLFVPKNTTANNCSGRNSLIRFLNEDDRFDVMVWNDDEDALFNLLL